MAHPSDAGCGARVGRWALGLALAGAVAAGLAGQPVLRALLPPLVAIGTALLWRRTLLALFLGIWAGTTALALGGGAAAWAGPALGLRDLFAVYLHRELTDSFRFEILGFVVALLAMVGVMSRAGGVAGLVDRLLVRARGPRSGQAVTFASGLVVFFDDYANCMLVGSSLRPLTDRLRISREKLAFIVDSTAAPVAGLSLFSTWIAFQVSLFAPHLPAVGISDGAYAVFVASLPFRFYCWLALAFVLSVALSGRDFGPMRAAEARARREGVRGAPGGLGSAALARLEPAPQMPRRAGRALAPLALTLVAALGGIVLAGGGAALASEPGGAWRDAERWLDVLIAGSGAGPIFVGALAGLALAVGLAGSNALRAGLVAGATAAAASAAHGLGAAWLAGAAASAGLAAGAAAAWLVPATRRPHLVAREIGRAAAVSAPTLGFASVLLFEAWMIGAVCSDLGTADTLAGLLGGRLRPELLPALLFAAAAGVAFATGSSWSTMSILVPNAVPLAAALGAESALGGPGMVALAIAAVLDGAIFGDHCSPISDTTVLSSVASGCDLLDHVRTQLPYALAVGTAAVALGYLPAALGGSPWLGLAGGAAALAGLLFVLGRPAPPAPGAGAPAA